jgi:hypothetical protein
MVFQWSFNGLSMVFQWFFNGISMVFPDSMGCLFHHRNGSAALDREKVLSWQIAAEVGARCSEYQK